MDDAGQPYSAAAKKLLARHNKKVEKKHYDPEPDFNRIFLKKTKVALRPLPYAATQRLDWTGTADLDKVMNDVHMEMFRMADIPHTCATCALRCIKEMEAPPCIWEISGPIDGQAFGKSCVCCVLKNQENDCCTIPAFFGDNTEAAIALCDLFQASRDYTCHWFDGPDGDAHRVALKNRYIHRRDYFNGLKYSHPRPPKKENGNGSPAPNKRKRSLNDTRGGPIKAE